MTGKELARELNMEARSTRRILERVPFDKINWKPHDKSMSLGRLATHIAEIPHWISNIVELDEYDFLQHPYTPHEIASMDELLALHEKNVQAAASVLEGASDEQLKKKWVVRRGEQVFFRTAERHCRAFLGIQPRVPSPRAAHRVPPAAGRSRSRFIRPNSG